MGRKNENSRSCTYTIRIICEGEKTEPLFFTSLCAKYKKVNEGMDIRTIPQPRIPDDNEDSSIERHGYHGKSRKVNGHVEDKDPDEITGVPPLKWVLYAKKQLSEGIDEAWAVYDKDEHPKQKEAFEEANEEIDGKKVNIAFTSRSFEYYLLLHFEYLYKAFEETECGTYVHGKKQYYKCGSHQNPKQDCHGEKCINGYAREKGYWQESKTSESTFPLVEKYLRKGIVNACKLRKESDAQTDAPFYERNPYTNADKLVGRLIHVDGIEYGDVYENKLLKMQLYDEQFTIENMGKVTALIKASDLQVFDCEKNSYQTIIEKNIIIEPESRVTIDCKLTTNEVISYKRNLIDEILFVSKSR